MTDLTKSRRAVALRIAEAIDSEWPNLNMEGFDVDEATDIIEAMIPLTAAEAEAEMDAIYDDDDDDDGELGGISPSQPVVNPTMQALRDAVGVQSMSIIDTIKTATELIHSLRELVTVTREARDAAENAAKEAVQAEMAKLRAELAAAKEAVECVAMMERIGSVEIYRFSDDTWMVDPTVGRYFGDTLRAALSAATKGQQQ